MSAVNDDTQVQPICFLPAMSGSYLLESPFRYEAFMPHQELS